MNIRPKERSFVQWLKLIKSIQQQKKIGKYVTIHTRNNVKYTGYITHNTSYHIKLRYPDNRKDIVAKADIQNIQLHEEKN